MCGQVHWQAAKTKAKSLQKLDETGVMVAGCQHALMQKAVNMWTGEMYGYGFYLQKHVLPPIGVKFLVYDVICKYWPWMQRVYKSNSQSVDASITPGAPWARCMENYTSGLVEYFMEASGRKEQGLPLEKKWRQLSSICQGVVQPQRT